MALFTKRLAAGCLRTAANPHAHTDGYRFTNGLVGANRYAYYHTVANADTNPRAGCIA